MEQFLSLPDGPIVPFTILLLVVLIVPPIFERLRLPGLVGLLFAGVILGSDGLGLLDPEAETMKLLSDIGKVYLMFVAGLEIDLAEFRKTKNRSMGFGLATFLVPLITGTTVGRLFGFDWNASILIGSLFASHTLLAYPIIQRFGVVQNEAVIVTIGATIFTDISALLVLAICVSIHAGAFSPLSLGIQLSSLAIYTFAVLFGLSWAGRVYFRRTGNQEGNQFLFILLAVFLASVGAQIINVELIVGAFLAGLAVNDVVGHSPVEEKIQFVGGTLFIPFFFVDMGLLIDIPAFIQSLTASLPLTIAIVVGLIGSKCLATLVVKLLYGYDWPQFLTMWSLSLPQVAATLAAALVGWQVGILNEAVFNGVIVLMLVTSILGPLLTQRYALKLVPPKVDLPPDWEPWWDEADLAADAEAGSEGLPSLFTVVVPVSNPLTERYLIELAALLAQRESGVVVPLSIVKAHAHMDEPHLTRTLQRSRHLLKRAVEVSQRFGAPAEPEIRIDDDVAEGVCRAAREKNASLIVMGWSEMGLRSRLFGTLTDSVFWASHCPVAVTRLLDEPTHIRHILVPMKNLAPQALRTMRFAQLFAEANQASVTALHVCDRRTPPDQIAEFESEFSHAIALSGPQGPITIKAIAHDDVAPVILKTAQSFDLIVLRSMRRRTAGGLAVSDVTTQVIQEWAGSVVLFGEPHH